jgi:hypothetical protein
MRTLAIEIIVNPLQSRSSIGNGGGSADNGIATAVGLTLFNGTGGGTASGGAGGFVGINPNTPVIFGNFALGP